MLKKYVNLNAIKFNCDSITLMHFLVQDKTQKKTKTANKKSGNKSVILYLYYSVE